MMDEMKYYWESAPILLKRIKAIPNVAGVEAGAQQSVCQTIQKGSNLGILHKFAEIIFAVSNLPKCKDMMLLDPGT